MTKYNFDKVDGLENGSCRTELSSDREVVDIYTVDKKWVASVSRNSSVWPDVLRVHGFDVPKFPVITPNDRETLKAMDKLFYHILYASAIEGKKYVRVYQKGCYRGAGDMWHLKDVLSPSLVEFIIEMGKVEIEDLLKM